MKKTKRILKFNKGKFIKNNSLEKKKKFKDTFFFEKRLFFLKKKYKFKDILLKICKKKKTLKILKVTLVILQFLKNLFIEFLVFFFEKYFKKKHIILFFLKKYFNKFVRKPLKLLTRKRKRQPPYTLKKLSLNFLYLGGIIKLKKFNLLNWVYDKVSVFKKEIFFNHYCLINGFKNLFFLNKEDLKINNFIFIKKKRRFNIFYDLNYFLNYKFLENELFIVDKFYLFSFFFFESFNFSEIDFNIKLKLKYIDNKFSFNKQVNVLSKIKLI